MYVDVGEIMISWKVTRSLLYDIVCKCIREGSNLGLYAKSGEVV